MLNFIGYLVLVSVIALLVSVVAINIKQINKERKLESAALDILKMQYNADQIENKKLRMAKHLELNVMRDRLIENQREPRGLIRRFCQFYQLKS